MCLLLSQRFSSPARSRPSTYHLSYFNSSSGMWRGGPTEHLFFYGITIYIIVEFDSNMLPSFLGWQTLSRLEWHHEDLYAASCFSRTSCRRRPLTPPPAWSHVHWFTQFILVPIILHSAWNKNYNILKSSTSTEPTDGNTSTPLFYATSAMCSFTTLPLCIQHKIISLH